MKRFSFEGLMGGGKSERKLRKTNRLKTRAAIPQPQSVRGATINLVNLHAYIKRKGAWHNHFGNQNEC